jgi:hypothetical protein
MPIQEGRLFGKFKALLLLPEDLKIEAESLREQFIHLRENKDKYTPPIFLWEWIKIYLSYRIKKRGHRIPNWDLVGPPDWNLEIFGFHEPLRIVFRNWNSRDWNIVLTEHLPSSIEMAEIQATGRRYVSLDWVSCLNGTLVDEKRDSLEHVLHDLAHSYTFFESKYQKEEQIQFFKELLLDLSRFEDLCEKDPIFKSKLDYCLADMNSHPEHLKAYLKAIVMEFFLRGEGKKETQDISIHGREEFNNFISKIRVLNSKNLE